MLACRMTSTPFAYRSLTLVMMLLLVGGVARADDAQRARELFKEGTTFFDVGQFDKVIEAWQRGYKEKPDPGFLYNIGQAYRLSGDPHKAIFFYRGFLRNSPKAPNRADIEQKIAALQKQIADQELAKSQAGASGAAPAGNAPPPVTAAPPPPASPPPPVLADATAAPMPPPSPAPSLGGYPPGTTEQLAATPPPPPSGGEAAPGRLGLGAALGFDSWGKSVNGDAQPSFAFALSGGYTFWGGPERKLAFGLGAVIGFSFLDESSTTASWKETP